MGKAGPTLLLHLPPCLPFSENTAMACGRGAGGGQTVGSPSIQDSALHPVSWKGVQDSHPCSVLHWGDFALQGTSDNVWRHFSCHKWESLLASSGERPGIP